MKSDPPGFSTRLRERRPAMGFGTEQKVQEVNTWSKHSSGKLSWWMSMSSALRSPGYASMRGWARFNISGLMSMAVMV